MDASFLSLSTTNERRAMNFNHNVTSVRTPTQTEYLMTTTTVPPSSAVWSRRSAPRTDGCTAIWPSSRSPRSATGGDVSVPAPPSAPGVCWNYRRDGAQTVKKKKEKHLLIHFQTKSPPQLKETNMRIYLACFTAWIQALQSLSDSARSS